MRRQRSVWALAAAAAATALSFWLDPWVWHHVGYPAVYDHDWGRLLRVMGSLVLWLPLAIAVWLERRAERPEQARWATLLVVGPAIAGGLAEILKIVIRRDRPGLHDGAYAYRGFVDHPFDTSAFGFPSSHTMVAFGGAAVLARFYPRAAVVGYALAAGCGLTRLLAQAHFTSDVVAGAIAGWAVGTWLTRRFLLRPSPLLPG